MFKTEVAASSTRFSHQFTERFEVSDVDSSLREPPSRKRRAVKTEDTAEFL